MFVRSFNALLVLFLHLDGRVKAITLNLEIVEL